MILVGTDLSMASRAALQAGASLARKLERELLLVTIVENSDAATRAMAGMQLEQDAAELRRDFQLSVESLVLEGAPDTQLLQLAQRRAVSLIVVGAEGSSRRNRRIGSVAEQLCQQADVPVLVARHAERLAAWSRGSTALNVLVGSGIGDASKSALAYVTAWSDVRLTVAHVAWPYGEHYRLGTSGPMPLDHLRPEVHQRLLSDLERWVSDVPTLSAPRLRVVPGWGRVDTHLAQLAHEAEADVLVLGTHQRNLSGRLWHGSVSRNALHEAACNVLCVPQGRLAHVAARPRTLVVPTDFSPLADRAVRVAYSLLPEGGRVHLVHVARQASPQAQAELAARVPGGVEQRGVETELQVLVGAEPWLAIWQYAGRVGADLICMSTHSRAPVANLILGSQAQALLQHSRIPVLLVPLDREA